MAADGRDGSYTQLETAISRRYGVREDLSPDLYMSATDVHPFGRIALQGSRLSAGNLGTADRPLQDQIFPLQTDQTEQLPKSRIGAQPVKSRVHS